MSPTEFPKAPPKLQPASHWLQGTVSYSILTLAVRWSRMRSGCEGLPLNFFFFCQCCSTFLTGNMDMQRKYICGLWLSVQVGFALDSVRFANPPLEPVAQHPLEVFYSCDAPATVQLDCMVTFDIGDSFTSLLRRWHCLPGKPRKRTLRVSLPDWLVYRPDGIVPESRWVLSCILGASVRYRHETNGEWTVEAQDVATLQPRSKYSRPTKRHLVCFTWGARMLRFVQDHAKKQCPVEQETVPLLSSIFASTGGKFGIVKNLRPHASDVLEHLRLQSLMFPWSMFSIWLMVTRHCQDSTCGVLHHIDPHNNYATPAILLTQSGLLHVQVHGGPGESTAILFPHRLPLSEWCQLTVALRGREVKITIVCLGEEFGAAKSTENRLRHDIRLDDTDGYFVIGGGRYVKGTQGYFGPSVYYRNRAPIQSPSEVVLPKVVRDVDLTRWMHACRQFSLHVNQSVRFYSLLARHSQESGNRLGAFHSGKRKDTPNTCELWEATFPRYVAKIAEYLAFKRGGRGVSPEAVGRALYSLSLRKLATASSERVLAQILPPLLKAACLNNTAALHMSSVLYSLGVGVDKKPNKAWLLALLAAQKSHRLALLQLGHLHHLGLHGVSADEDVAYAYYANAAKRTIADRQNPTPKQVYVEDVYLHNDEILGLQTNENHHIFQWLKFQANQGAPDAEQAVARMLFWGQRGVSPNMKAALRHYERGAVRLEDPVSMYDFAIVLLQGFVPAISALAWYYERLELNYEKAVELWEQADALESPDAALNLGIVHSLGLYPQRPADQYVAYKYFLKAAERGHIRGVAEVADVWSTGLPGRVSRRPLDAVLWAKSAAEQNGYLGRLLRQALDAFLNNELFVSLVYYMMAGELGVAAAHFNAAYLCDQNEGGFLPPAFALRCKRKYYNLSIHHQEAEPYALLRMGDMWREGLVDGRESSASAAEMYKLAALRNEPQGWYNLGLLVEEGFRPPTALLAELGLSRFTFADEHSLATALYQRCRDSGNSDSFLPCSLALLSVYLRGFHKEHCALLKLFATVAAAAPVVLVVLGLLGRRILART
ncbi:protein sel-1 homolog 3 isoform X2 [Hippocampus comes]|uniref:protein sel-1 homolog 3 isoform X2 n=1 Tax=Hippocampus comes TaxID=109280 RepID=UPI00094EA018|nr:PREDICTED: protein sel-1 homolog 3 isoform X2 [Hippocampus comes]